MLKFTVLLFAAVALALEYEERPTSPPPPTIRDDLTVSKWFSAPHPNNRAAVPSNKVEPPQPAGFGGGMQRIPLSGGFGNSGLTKVGVVPGGITRLPKYKLHYFDIRFRGEPIRLIFNYKHAPFEDYRVNDKDWPILKWRYPYGQLPVLDIDNTRIPQSFAIYRYMGRAFNLTGANDVDNAKIESLSEEFRELEQKCTVYLDMLLGTVPGGPTPPSEKEKQLQNVAAPAIKLHGGRLEKALAESSSGYFGSEVSWVDFVVADFTKTLLDNASKRYMVYNKQLRAHMNKVYGLPGVKEYIAKRKEAPV